MPRSNPHPPGRREVTMLWPTPVTLLLMDDERSFVRVLATLLRRDGSTVDTADNGELALALIEKRHYDVILYDIQMPARTVPTFSDIVKLLFPALWQRIIFLTADTFRLESMAFLKQSGQPWLAKPCTIAAVRSAIAQVLHNAAEQRSQQA